MVALYICKDVVKVIVLTSKVKYRESPGLRIFIATHVFKPIPMGTLHSQLPRQILVEVNFSYTVKISPMALLSQ